MQKLVPESPAALRHNNLDALRLAMALAVVWSHSFALWYGTEAGEPVSRLMNGIYNSGNLAVLVFFTISGFLITHSFTRSRCALQYIRKRVARIHPGYIVATLVCSLLIVPAYSSRPFGIINLQELRGLASNLFLRNYIVQSNAFGDGAVNGSLWSIPYEFWCYLGVMGLGFAGLLGRRFIAPALAIVVMGIRVWLDLTDRRPDGGWLAPIIGYAYFWFNVLPPFMLGMTVYLYRDWLPRSLSILLSLTVSLLVSAHLPLAAPENSVLPRLLLPPTLAYATFYLAFSDRLRAHGASRFGDFSYGAYLYAFPIQQMLKASLLGRISFGVYVCLSMLLSLVAGVLSWHLVERWFVQQKARQPLNEEANLVAP